jgi:transcriptional repressor NrdR
MDCPFCNYIDSKVVDSRDAGTEGIRRRRQCGACSSRFTTYERIQTATISVIKRDGRREEFNRDKLLRSLRIACAKRPLTAGSLEKIAHEIESYVQDLGRSELSSHFLGEMIISHLQSLDRVAYIRYASVYRDFQDLDSFRREVDTLIEKGNSPLVPDPQLSFLPLDPPITNKKRRRSIGARKLNHQ